MKQELTKKAQQEDEAKKSQHGIKLSKKQEIENEGRSFDLTGAPDAIDSPPASPGKEKKNKEWVVEKYNLCPLHNYNKRCMYRCKNCFTPQQFQRVQENRFGPISG